MTFPVVLKFHEKLPEYAMSLGDSDIPFGGAIKGPLSSTGLNVPRYEDQTLFERCYSLDPQKKKQTEETVKRNPDNKPVHIGGVSVLSQYNSPYPTTFDYICVCEYCLKYMGSDYTVHRHHLKCKARTPPGREIYKVGEWSVWEVDGAVFKVYCQNVCLFAKLFLESKTLYYDVEPFKFYILTKHDGFGSKFVGYFSKQKIYCGMQTGQQINNVSCIMVIPLPEYRGLGQFLIGFSYILTFAQGATGTPEKPLSYLGSRSYETFWRYSVALCLLQNRTAEISIRQISKLTTMTLNDVIYTLEVLQWLKDGKLEVDFRYATFLVQQWQKRQPLALDNNLLLWAP